MTKSLWTAVHVVTKRTRRVCEGDYFTYGYTVYIIRKEIKICCDGLKGTPKQFKKKSLFYIFYDFLKMFRNLHSSHIFHGLRKVLYHSNGI